MKVSWDWLGEYVDLKMSVDEAAHRLTMSGLNLEEHFPVGTDQVIDLEVTSNRPDCLGHIGVAREIAALFQQQLSVPEATLTTVDESVEQATSVEILADDLCPRYLARIVRGVKVGPSPDWLRLRLEAIGIESINNVVDVTNYVLMECGQPLHAFDFDQLDGGRIIVRRARPGEKLEAINHTTYELTDQNCVIADASRPVAIAGVMGGAATEISSATRNVLIETAAFAPLSVRNTARQLNLRSDSSYRFERGVDLQRLDWASRRCCELIQQVAGGEILEGCVAAGADPAREPVTVRLRFAQIHRLLGMAVGAAESTEILSRLGCSVCPGATAESAEFQIPSWRRDLTREIDLIEEVARIHGYENIPEEPPLPVVATKRTLRDRVALKVRDTLTALGFFEAITLSFTSEEQAGWFRPHAELDLLVVDHSSRRRENVLRQSLIPSLLQCRRDNERQGTPNAELFEIARVFLEDDPARKESTVEPIMLGLVAGRDFLALKGTLTAVARAVAPRATITAEPCELDQFVTGRGSRVLLNGAPWGWLGELCPRIADRIGLRAGTVVAEVNLELLEQHADLVPHFRPLAQYPGIQRDLNLLLDEQTSWSQVEAVVASAAGPLLDSIGFGGMYRGQQITAGKKSYVISIGFRAEERTLTADEVDAAQQQILAACERELGAVLRA